MAATERKIIPADDGVPVGGGIRLIRPAAAVYIPGAPPLVGEHPPPIDANNMSLFPPSKERG